MRASGSRFTAAVAAALALGIGASYANSFDIPFAFDDAHSIVQNPAIRSLSQIPRYFVDPSTFTILRENQDLRPVLQVTYALNYAVSGLAPWSWHALNLT